jgi:N,N'-diacetyllegionaminate synthase
LEPNELIELVKGCKAVKLALGDTKKILPKERPVLKFARECVVTSRKISKGEILSQETLTTKRPSTGPIPAKNYYKIIGKKAKTNIAADKQLSYGDII